MKRHISLLFVMLPWAAFAQDPSKSKPNDLLGQGTFSVNVGVGGRTGSSGGTYGRVAPKAQYFLKNGWSVNVEGRHETNGRQSGYTGIGLTTRYYVLRTNKVTVFGQGGYFYGQSRNRTYTIEATPNGGVLRVEQINRSGTVNAGVGAQYRLGKRWSVEAQHEINVSRRSADKPTSLTQTTIGINFLLKEP